MTWTLHRWTWALEGPLFVGHLPAGSLNRCRLYVPARAMWGALTAEAARVAAANGDPDYAGVGETLREHARFSYLYPAELDGSWVAWLPRYDNGGLIWRREDNRGESVPERRFRRRLLSTRPGTSIDPGSDSAADGSLRETEYVCDRWRARDTDRRVAYVGYIFSRHAAWDHIGGIDRLFVGGDTRYGLGALVQVSCDGATSAFGAGVGLSGDDPTVDTHRVLAHAASDDGLALRGAREAVTGWDRADLRFGDGPMWAPGSAAPSNDTSSLCWTVDASGCWRSATMSDSFVGR